jgi:hypothetical protein
MKKKLKTIQLLIGLIIVGHLTGCMATTHTVGTGGKGNCKNPGQYDMVAKQWYLFGGLMPLSPIKDSKTLVGEHQNYTIRTTNTFTDVLLSSVLVLVPFVNFVFPRVQTIRVSYGDNGNVNNKSNSSVDKFTSLKTLKELLDSGAISKDEYESEKSKLLGK